MWSVSNFVMVRLYMIPPKSFGRGGWACLREVPISETLQIYYYNKKVLFLYLSPLLVIIGWWWSWCPEAGAQSVSWVFVALCGVYERAQSVSSSFIQLLLNATTDPSEGALLSLSPPLFHSFCLSCLSIAAL